MFVKDHINLIGDSPLRGLIYEDKERQYPSMFNAYDPQLRKEALRTAEELDIPAFEGIYAGVAGPAYETPSEANFIHSLGATAVGMSTVPEVQSARQEGAKVLCLSLLTNMVDKEQVSDTEVARSAKEIAPQVARFLDAYLPKIKELI